MGDVNVIGVVLVVGVVPRRSRASGGCGRCLGRRLVTTFFNFLLSSPDSYHAVAMEVHPGVISSADLVEEDGMDTQMADDSGRPSFPAISAVDAAVRFKSCASIVRCIESAVHAGVLIA